MGLVILPVLLLVAALGVGGLVFAGGLIVRAERRWALAAGVAGGAAGIAVLCVASAFLPYAGASVPGFTVLFRLLATAVVQAGALSLLALGAERGVRPPLRAAALIAAPLAAAVYLRWGDDLTRVLDIVFTY